MVRKTSKALESPDKPSIAVLPFANMRGDPEQEYFSEGLTEDLITDLSKISGLFVMARNSTFLYKGKSVRVQEVTQELGVQYVLEGSVYLWKKQHEKGIGELEKALAIAPNNADCYALLGNILTWTGKPKEAVQEIKRAMRLNPRYPARDSPILSQQDAHKFLSRALCLNGP